MEFAKVIAIDGPAASGKSSAAVRVAQTLGVPCVNTGSMYRAVTWYLQCHKLRPFTDERIQPLVGGFVLNYLPDEHGVFRLEINGEFPGEALRSQAVASEVSVVAALPCVRAALLDVQRAMARNGWIVMEGRDIGTVVFPDAPFKFFVTATPEERARRRLAQKEDQLAGMSLEEVARSIAERDRIDSTRAAAPLRPAEDAILLDTTGMTLDEVVNFIVERVRTCIMN